MITMHAILPETLNFNFIRVKHANTQFDIITVISQILRMTCMEFLIRMKVYCLWNT